MVSMFVDGRGLPCQIKKRCDDSDDFDSDDIDDEYTIVGQTDAELATMVEMFHYDGNDLEELKEAMMSDTLYRAHSVESNLVQEFKATHQRSPHPLWSLSLYDHIIKGHIYFATAHTNTLIVTYAGTDLTRPFKKAVRACKAQGWCTYSVTRKSRTRQYAFRCATCFPGDDNMVICEPCAVKCHKVRVRGPLRFPL